jgi:hypothetical protein
MTMLRTLALMAALSASPALAWQEPPRGSDLRADLMDAIRPLAEWYLNPPVEFVVHEARVQGDRAFVSLHAQRPGGGVIDPATAPGVLRGEVDGFAGDPTTMQALLQRSGRMWVAVHYGIAATDVWYSDPDFCPGWGGVLPEFCNSTMKN